MTEGMPDGGSRATVGPRIFYLCHFESICATSSFLRELGVVQPFVHSVVHVFLFVKSGRVSDCGSFYSETAGLLSSWLSFRVRRGI